MRAALKTAHGVMGPAEVAMPVPAGDELLVRVEAAGICGSDRHMFLGEYPTAVPVIQGHEFSGIVIGAGPEAKRVPVGARITGDPNSACGHCPGCRAGRVNLCDNLQALGVTRNGGFAEYVIVPEAQAYELPLSLDPMHGSFAEPVACCLHGIDVARIEPGQSVAVLGGGVIGLIMVQLAKLAGAGTVVLSTRQEPRRKLSERIGADATVDPSAVDAVTAIREIVPGGVDVVLECAGVAETVAQAPRAAKRGGAVIVFGVMPKGEPVAMEPFVLLTNEIRLEGAYLNPHTHGRAAELIASGRLKLDPLITRTIAIEEVPGVIAAPPGYGDVKVIAVP
jgi:2-desacetyl-2-hydroxyethyl bacteriochlorophyllide A dehydrogenase